MNTVIEKLRAKHKPKKLVSGARTVVGDHVTRFVGKQLDTTIYPPFTSMGLERDGELVAGVVFNCFTGCDLHITAAGHFWQRDFLADVGRYVFEQLKCLRMTAVTEKAELVKMAERLGGEAEGLMRNHFGEGRHGYIIGFARENWGL